MKLTKDEFNSIYIISMFISGLILIILGIFLYKNNLMMYVGIGLLSGSMIISIMEILMKK
mgnify:CR=1 FL=1